MQYNPYQPNHMPHQAQPMQGGINPAQHIQASLQMLGVSTAQFAQEAERVGIGHAAAIQRALEMGDASPLQAYVQQRLAGNPQLVQQAGACFGQMYGSPQPSGAGGQQINRYIQ